MMVGRVNTRVKAARRAFTLTELLVVVALIIAMLMILLPALQSFQRGRIEASANTQLVADMNNARHRAIISGSPVYVVFFPLYSDLHNAILRENGEEMRDGFVRNDIDSDIASNNLLGGQLISYAFHSEGGAGDQPTYNGSIASIRSKSYLSEWKRLPQGTFIPRGQLLKLWALNKYAEDLAGADGGWTKDASGNRYYAPRPRAMNNRLDDPSENHKLPLPYIGFGPHGQLLGVEPAKYNSETKELELQNDDYFHLEIATGTVLPPQKNPDTKFFSLQDADHAEERQGYSKYNRVQLNTLTGRPYSAITYPE